VEIGFNQNVPAHGKLYHVQTEDVEATAEIVTHVFMDGRILHTYRLSYADWKTAGSWQDRVAEQAKKQHTLMVAAIHRGRFEQQGA